MPLTFDSLSHGTIAFGFFNIESDMLLCDRYFLFADDFCRYVGDMAGSAGGSIYRASGTVQLIEAAEEIGDLMGAIHGVRFTGFIGELYRRFPFPRLPEEFKQNPEGAQTQSLVTEIISRYGKAQEIVVAADQKTMQVELGVYRFSHIQFQELLKYVWRGGYPRWKNEVRPAYVSNMKKQIMLKPIGIFDNIEFLD
jgi:hypothetical protein